MTVENISWSISTKCCPTWWGSNTWPHLITSWMPIQMSHRGRHISYNSTPTSKPYQTSLLSLSALISLKVCHADLAVCEITQGSKIHIVVKHDGTCGNSNRSQLPKTRSGADFVKVDHGDLVSWEVISGGEMQAVVKFEKTIFCGSRGTHPNLKTRPCRHICSQLGFRNLVSQDGYLEWLGGGNVEAYGGSSKIKRHLHHISSVRCF